MLALQPFGLALLGLLVLVAALAWINLSPTSRRWSPRVDKAIDAGWIALALLAAASSIPRMQLDPGELLHTSVEARVLGELEREHVAICVIVADRTRPEGVGLEGVEVLRDPATGERRPVRALAQASRRACMEAFAEQDSWTEFVAGVDVLAQLSEGVDWQPIVEGHRSRATPLRLLEHRLVFAVAPFSPTWLVALALVDLLVLIGALVYAARAFGRRSVALAALVMFVAIAFGPGPLRWLALAALIGALAAMHEQRWLLAGALLAFATLERVWPGFFALAIGSHLVAGAIAERRLGPELRRWLSGYLAGLALLFGLTSLLPGGLHNWAYMLEQLRGIWPSGHYDEVGLRWLFMLDGDLDGGRKWLDYPEKAEHLAARIAWLRLAGVMLLVPVLIAIRKLEAVTFTSIAGCIMMFAFGSVPAGAWTALGLLLLQAPRIALRERPITLIAAGCLALSVAMHGLLGAHPQPSFVHNVGHSSLLALLLLGLVLLLVLEPTLREGVTKARVAKAPVAEARVAEARVAEARVAEARVAEAPVAGEQTGTLKGVR
jgi:hypothetical protein